MGLFKKLVRLGIHVAVAPVAVAIDTVTMGTESLIRDESYVESLAKEIKKDVVKVTRDVREKINDLD